MFIKGCIGDLCHLAVVDPCYIFQGGLCALPEVFGRLIYMSVCSLNV